MYPQLYVVLTAVTICAAGRGSRRMCVLKETSVVIMWEGKQRQRYVRILDGIQEVSGGVVAFDDIVSPAVD